MIPAKIEITAEGVVAALREYLVSRGNAVAEIHLVEYNPGNDTDNTLVIAEVTTDLSAARTAPPQSPLQAAVQGVIDARAVFGSDRLPDMINVAINELRDAAGAAS